MDEAAVDDDEILVVVGALAVDFYYFLRAL
jgi:hypothetical protein